MLIYTDLMVKVIISPEADREIGRMPRAIQIRFLGVAERLQKWPDVSGAKPLRRELKGLFRIRTGDYRIVFRPVGETLLIVRIDHRKDVYED